jgi:hypothetical protein
MGLASAAVAIDAVQMRGVPPLSLLQLRMLWPMLRHSANARRAVSLSP